MFFLTVGSFAAAFSIEKDGREAMIKCGEIEEDERVYRESN